jgi:nitrogen fixation/metabolism regulation signal transduction histidine kinase
MPDGGLVPIEAIDVSKVASETIVVRLLDESVGSDQSCVAGSSNHPLQLKFMRTGLGLSISREIADFHGATLALLPRGDRLGTIAQIDFRAFSTRASDQEPSEIVSVSESTSQTV